MTKPGFTLLELIVVLLITSMIGTILTTALYQSSRIQRTVDVLFDTSVRLAVFNHQIQKDFSGAFIPTQARLKDDKDDEEAEQKGEDQKAAESKEPKKAEKKEKEDTEQSPKKVSKPSEKPVQKIFYSTNKDGQCDRVTCITNNPLSVFVNNEVGTVKPKVVRVMYTLKPMPGIDRKDVFALYRQESIDLEIEKIAAAREYELMTGVKHFSVMYTMRTEKKEGDQKNKDEKKPVVYEYKTMPEWVSEQEKKEQPVQKENKDAQDEQQPVRIPFLMTIKVSLWNAQYTKAEDFVVTVSIPIDTSAPKKKEDQKKDTAKPEDKGQKTQQDKKGESVDQKGKKEKAEELLGSLTMTLGNFNGKTIA